MTELRKNEKNLKKIYRVKMISSILINITDYLSSIISHLNYDFDDYEEFDDSIMESIVSNVKSTIKTLEEYLQDGGCKDDKE